MSTIDFKNKILEGSRIGVRKLIEKKRREGGYLIVSDNGKVVKIKASEIKI